jgi:hypothetical protein
VTPLTSLVVVKPDSKEKGDFDDADEMAEKKITFRYQEKVTLLLFMRILMIVIKNITFML